MSKIKICLDAGHYGKYNHSPVVKNYYESDMAWKLHLLLKKHLEQYGIEVITTRAIKEKDLDLYSRGAASKGCDLFLSLHSNAASSEKVDYVVCMHMIDDNCGAIDEQSMAVAQILADCVAGIMGTKARTWSTKSSVDRDGNGYKDDYYGVLRGAHSVKTPGVIIEHGFHTNKAQATWLLDDSNLDKLAEAEADVIAAYFGLKKAEVSTAEPEHWYRIRKLWDKPETQKGAYKSLDNAKDDCPDGYSVFDWNGNAVHPKKVAHETTKADKKVLLTVDGKWGKSTTARLQQIFGTAVDGVVSNQWVKYKTVNPGLTSGWSWKDKPNGKGSQLIKTMQAWAGMPSSDQDGEIGNETIKALQKKLGSTVDGRVSNPSQMVKALQMWANNQRL